LKKSQSNIEGADAVYHAIGRFFVAFSHLHSTAELLVVHLLASDDPRRAWAAISGSTTQPIAETFFSILCEVAADEWTREDHALVLHARKQIDGLISERNRIAHDIWSLGEHPNRPLPDGSHAERIRYGRSPKSGVVVTASPVTVLELHELFNKTERLRAVLRALSLTGLPNSHKKPTDLLCFEDENSVTVIK
jgi:hypothetical protein